MSTLVRRFRRHLLVPASLSSFVLASLSMLLACEPPQVVDLPASALSVKITVADTDESPADGRVPIFVQVLSNGKLVQLGNNAAISCNGVAMPWQGVAGYAGRVPLVPTNGTYDCVHQRNSVATTASIAVPPRPVFVSPLQAATVIRSNSLTIQYLADGGVAVSASAGDGKVGLGHNDQPDTGSYTGFDVSTLQAGPGSIGLARDFTSTLAGTGFQSVEVSYTSGSDIDVVWQ